MDKKFNIMDTPGYLDFMSEALAALHVADFAIVVVHAQHGIGVKHVAWGQPLTYDSGE